MDRNGDFDTTIINMDRELRNLKTAHNVGASVAPYYYQFRPTSLAPITITYGNGKQNIITQVFADGDVILRPVIDNTQTLFISAQTSTNIWLVSTRPITSVVQNMV